MDQSVARIQKNASAIEQNCKVDKSVDKKVNANISYLSCTLYTSSMESWELTHEDGILKGYQKYFNKRSKNQFQCSNYLF